MNFLQATYNRIIVWCLLTVWVTFLWIYIKNPHVSQQKCPLYPNTLVGRLQVNTTSPANFDAIPAIWESNPPLLEGGRWIPRNCTARRSLAVIMTYRNRTNIMKIMLQHIHPFLQKQLIEYQVFIVEPTPDLEFNRGMLKNIGYLEATKINDFSCVVFQDIDLLPEYDFNKYICLSRPKHLISGINTSNYEPIRHKAVFGGAVLFPTWQFKIINGYSNYYFGWGGEDDDLLSRVESHGFSVDRTAPYKGKYIELSHKKDTRGETIFPLFNSRMSHQRTDGLSSLEYQVLNIKTHLTYTWIKVRYDQDMYKQRVKEFLTKVSKIQQTQKELGNRTQKSSTGGLQRVVIKHN